MTMHTRQLTRRHILALGALAAASIASACGDESAATSTAAPAVATPLRPTPAPPTATIAIGAAATVAPTAPTAPTVPTVGPVAAGATAVPARTDGKIPAPNENVPDAFLVPPPVFTAIPTVPGKGGKVTTFQFLEGPPPLPRDQNLYWQELEKRIGATLEVTWGPDDTFREKAATVLASGNIPDLVWLNPPSVPDQYRAIQQGAFTDLTPYLTGDALKQFPNLAAFPAATWKNVAINKKIYGVPRPRTLARDSLIYRQDWAEKIGVPNPRNADEFFNMMVAFAKNDPDGNGKADTYAQGSSGGTFNLLIFRAIHRAPSQWRLNPDGSLLHEIETEEYKQAVAFARRLWEAGAYHPDSASMSASIERNGFHGGKIGTISTTVTIDYGGVGGLAYKTRELSPGANVRALVPFGHDGGKGVTYNGPGFHGFSGMAARVGKDPERVRELLRILDYFAAPFGSEEQVFRNYGTEGVHHTRKPDGTRDINDRGKREIGDQFGLPNLPNLTNAPQVFYYPGTTGDAEYVQNVAKEMSAIGIDNPTLNVYSPTAVTKSAELTQLGRDRITALVTGREPFSAYDAWVRDWRSRGGDAIRKEYEQALKG